MFSYWNELVWNKKQITPIVAARNTESYMTLNVYKTVQNLIQVDEFWTSEEFRSCLLNKNGGHILSLDYHFWTEEIIDFLHSKTYKKEEFEKLFLVILNDYLDSQPFSELSKRLLPLYHTDEILHLFSEFKKLSLELLNPPPSNSNLFSFFSVSSWDSLQLVSLLNGILFHFIPFLRIISTTYSNTNVNTEISKSLTRLKVNLSNSFDFETPSTSSFSKYPTFLKIKWVIEYYGKYLSFPSPALSDQLITQHLMDLAVSAIYLHTQIHELLFGPPSLNGALPFDTNFVSPFTRVALAEKIFHFLKIPFSRVSNDTFIVGHKRKGNSHAFFDDEFSQRKKKKKTPESSLFRNDDEFGCNDANDCSLVTWNLPSIESTNKTTQYSLKDVSNYLSNLLLHANQQHLYSLVIRSKEK